MELFRSIRKAIKLGITLFLIMLITTRLNYTLFHDPRPLSLKTRELLTKSNDINLVNFIFRRISKIRKTLGNIGHVAQDFTANPDQISKFLKMVSLMLKDFIYYFCGIDLPINVENWDQILSKRKMKNQLRQKNSKKEYSECVATRVYKRLDSTHIGSFGYSIVPRSRKLPSNVNSDYSSFDSFKNKLSQLMGLEKQLSKNQRLGNQNKQKQKKLPLFYVGDVIVHKKYGYRGVIVGWDMYCRAPPMWILSMHKDQSEIARDTVHYKVLVDNRDRKNNQQTYWDFWVFLFFESKKHNELHLQHHTYFQNF